jgi:hypothetical protein
MAAIKRSTVNRNRQSLQIANFAPIRDIRNSGSWAGGFLPTIKQRTDAHANCEFEQTAIETLKQSA